MRCGAGGVGREGTQGGGGRHHLPLPEVVGVHVDVVDERDLLGGGHLAAQVGRRDGRRDAARLSARLQQSREDGDGGSFVGCRGAVVRGFWAPGVYNHLHALDQLVERAALERPVAAVGPGERVQLLALLRADVGDPAQVALVADVEQDVAVPALGGGGRWRRRETRGGGGRRGGAGGGGESHRWPVRPAWLVGLGPARAFSLGATSPVRLRAWSVLVSVGRSTRAP